jgi:DUF2993 family protein/FHA domain-containing protein
MKTATVTVVAGAGVETNPTELVITSAKPWVIGRSRDADVVINDARVSRRHLVIESAGPAWLVKDASSSGSWHNGSRVGPDGVTLQGTGRLRFNLGDRSGPEIVLFANSPVPAAEASTMPFDPALAASTAVLGSSAAASAAPAAQAAAPPAAQAAAPPAAQAPAPAAVALSRTPVKPAPATERPEPPGEPRPARTRRRGRRLAIALLVLVLLLTIADRAAAKLASKQAVAQVVQQSQGLTGKPSVSFGGFPFLTQVAFGKYTDINVKIGGITVAGAPRIQQISGHLKGAHIPLSKAIGGHVGKIPVDHVNATVAMTFADLNAFLKDQPGHMVLAQRKGALQFSGGFEQDGTTINVTGSAEIAADEDGLTITPKNIHATGSGDAGDVLDDVSGVLDGAGQFFPPVPVPMAGLPFNLRLTSVHVNGSGVTASARADHLILDGNRR